MTQDIKHLGQRDVVGSNDWRGDFDLSDIQARGLYAARSPATPSDVAVATFRVRTHDPLYTVYARR